MSKRRTLNFGGRMVGQFLEGGRSLMINICKLEKMILSDVDFPLVQQKIFLSMPRQTSHKKPCSSSPRDLVVHDA
jgi:hypothetical protein